MAGLIPRNGVDMQRFTLRTAKSCWSELNKERCRRLERLGLMTDAGRAVLPDISENGFVIDAEIMQAFQEHPVAWKNFCTFPPLYQRVRIDTIQRDKRKNRSIFEMRRDKLIAQSQAGKMFGEWNDYGRLLEDEKDTLESVRATHHFLSDAEMKQIKSYVPQALQSVSHLIVAVDASDEPIGFMGTEQNRLEMLFFSPAERGKEIGKQLVQYGIL